jgi:hypothetical protein
VGDACVVDVELDVELDTEVDVDMTAMLVVMSGTTDVEAT